MIDIASGHAAIDKFLADGYARVRGMSSRFAAAICGHLVRRQTELGVTGDIVEIGTFEGRFFIAMALGLAPGERAVGIDTFDWPDAGVLDRFVGNCASAGLQRERFVAWKEQSAAIAPDALRAKLAIGTARFIHIDGDHEHDSLMRDLELAHAVLHPKGLIVLDDMLHPGYPGLVVTVYDYLKRHPEMLVMCIIDRENISAAAKFVLCHANVYELYEADLMQTYARFHFTAAANVLGHIVLVLTPEPVMAEV